VASRIVLEFAKGFRAPGPVTLESDTYSQYAKKPPGR